MARRKAVYMHDTGSEWEEIMFKTVAEQVEETDERKFVSQVEKDSWNNKADRDHEHEQYVKNSDYKSCLFFDNKIKTIGHRGFEGFAPENTIASYRIAGKNKFWGAEGDVCETSDGHFVMLHSNTVDKMTNGTGEIMSLTFSQVRDLVIDAGNYVQYAPTQKVPTLQEYLEVCKTYGMIPVMETKWMRRENFSKYLEVLDEYAVRHCCIINSFRKEDLEALRQLDGTLKLGYLVETLDSEILDFCQENNYEAHVIESAVTKELVNEAHSKGVLICVWNLTTDERIKELVSFGVDYLVLVNQTYDSNNFMYQPPFVDFKGLENYRHVYEKGSPYEINHGRYYDENRLIGSTLNKLDGWETKVGMANLPSGLKSTVLFYDSNKLGIADLGWMSQGSVLDIPEGSVYYEIYISRSDDQTITNEDWLKAREVRATIF